MRVHKYVRATLMSLNIAPVDQIIELGIQSCHGASAIIVPDPDPKDHVMNLLRLEFNVLQCVGRIYSDIVQSGFEFKQKENLHNACNFT